MMMSSAPEVSGEICVNHGPNGISFVRHGTHYETIQPALTELSSVQCHV